MKKIAILGFLMAMSGGVYAAEISNNCEDTGAEADVHVDAKQTADASKSDKSEKANFLSGQEAQAGSPSGK